MAVSVMRKDYQMINLYNYASPLSERSLYKGIPISEIEQVRILMKARGIPYRFRFRGPRPSRKYQSYIPKTMATTFAVYRYGR